MKVSVIIPIYNARQFLGDLFDALNNNVFQSGDEILLVDNGSTDDSFKICKEMENKYPELYKTLTYTEKAGSYAARNFAVSKAEGDILVFTDSDTRPVKNWISTIRANVGDGIVLAGKIQLDIVNDGLWERFDSIAHLKSEENAKNNQIATANMAVMRKDFEIIGYFEERFSGGDYEWSQRAGAKGMNITFVPEALVHHPTRKTFAQILKKEQRIAYGTGNHYKNENKPLICLVIRYVLKVLKFDTNIRYIKLLTDMGCTKNQVFEFNHKFMVIRIQQISYAIKGYKMISAREIGIK